MGKGRGEGCLEELQALKAAGGLVTILFDMLMGTSVKYPRVPIDDHLAITSLFQKVICAYVLLLNPVYLLTCQILHLGTPTL